MHSKVIVSRRFSHPKTAFDVDIENLPEKPWRKPHTDFSDYFNYGFTGASFYFVESFD